MMNTTESGEHKIVLKKDRWALVVLCGHMHAICVPAGTCNRVCSHSEDRLAPEGVEHFGTVTPCRDGVASILQ